MAVTCTIESRIGSSRLPGKALFPFYETTVLGSVIANAKAARGIDRVIVCTTRDPRDDVIADYASLAGVDVFRGDEENVAGRLSAALAGFSGINIFLTGDNPLVTPDLIGLALEQFIRERPDYLCSTHMKYCDWWAEPPVLPKGLSVQLSDTAFFRQAVSANAEPHYLQHSTMVMYGKKLPGRTYGALALELDRPTDMAHSYTVDTAAEYLDLKSRWPERPIRLTDVLKPPPYAR